MRKIGMGTVCVVTLGDIGDALGGSVDGRIAPRTQVKVSPGNPSEDGKLSEIVLNFNEYALGCVGNTVHSFQLAVMEVRVPPRSAAALYILRCSTTAF